VLVGVNLLREGLDLPEVSLVAILDADKEGFLRNTRSLMQIAGRAARNAEGFVVLYADTITRSIREVLDETARRRTIQQAYNDEHGIVPRSIVKSVNQILDTTGVADAEERYRRRRFGLVPKPERLLAVALESLTADEGLAMVAELRVEMQEAAVKMEYEKAAYLRDEITKLEQGIGALPEKKG